MAAPGGRIPRRFTLPRRYHRALQITALREWARTQGVPGGPAVGSGHRPRLSTPADNQRHFFADGRATQATRQAPRAAPVTGLGTAALAEGPFGGGATRVPHLALCRSLLSM